MPRRAFIPIAAIVVGLAVAAGWLASRPVSVAVAKVARGPAVEAIYATGTVEPIRWVKAGPTVEGRIAEFNCEEGKTVKEGDLLVRLDDHAARARVAELQAMIRFRQKEVDRYKALLSQEFASRQVYERNLSDLEQARAALAAAEQALEDTRVMAPLDGVVLREDGEVGQVVKAGDALCWIGQAAPLRITAEVDEEDIPRLRPGQRALIKADAFPTQSLEGLVGDITPQGDPVSKSYRAYIALPSESPLMVGMTTELNILVREEEDAILVPVGAVRDGAVWVVEDGLARRRPVDVGVFGDERVEIRAGLDGEEAVILDPPADLEDGEPVRAAGG